MTLLKAGMFDIEIGGQPASIPDVFPDWHAHDRLGLVIDEALGGIGATHLLQIAMTLFYDVKPSRKSELTVYPEIYAFHVGKPRGAHAPYDFWPARREVILETTDHRVVLDAINDRGITRLAVPDRPVRDVIHRPKEEDAAFDRIASAFVYSPSGRVADPDLLIRGNDKRTEYNADQALKPFSEERLAAIKPSSTRPVKERDTSYVDWLRSRSADMTEEERQFVSQRRAELRQGGLATESYRRVSVAEALQRLASAGSGS
jgi:hypothetical protein